MLARWTTSPALNLIVKRHCCYSRFSCLSDPYLQSSGSLSVEPWAAKAALASRKKTCTLSVPSPNLLGQKLWGWGPVICVYCPPGNCDAHWSLRTIALTHLVSCLLPSSCSHLIHSSRKRFMLGGNCTILKTIIPDNFRRPCKTSK